MYTYAPYAIPDLYIVIVSVEHDRVCQSSQKNIKLYI